MRVACPKCHSRFAVADHLLKPSGRKLKCATCGAVWHALPEENAQTVVQESVPQATDSTTSIMADVEKESVETANSFFPDEKIPSDLDETLENTTALEDTLRAEGATWGRDANEWNERGEKNDEIPLESEGMFTADSSADSAAFSFDPRRPTVHPRPEESAGFPDSRLNLDELVLDDDPGPIPSIFASGFDDGEEEQNNGPRRLLMGAGIGVMVVVIGLGGAWLGREQVFRVWPELQNSLAGWGLPVINVAESLKLSDVTTLIVMEEGVRVLLVKGVMENVAAVSIPVPSMRLVFRDENRHIVRKGETMAPPIATLPPGEKAKFVFRLQNPPAGATVDIGFDRT
ncbi:MAG: hypothetical protein FD149_281 [Rhodospirillaceae bacterium]|nr:MAG: hypothetical protein FD149_281 [Rhodospirillaceae bacterium]